MLAEEPHQAAHAVLPGLATAAPLLVLGVLSPNEFVRPTEDVFPRVPFDAEQFTDRGHRHFGRHIAYEIRFTTVGQLVDEMGRSAIDHVVCDLVDSVFQQFHAARREAAIGHRSVLAVLGRVHVDQVGHGQFWIVGAAITRSGHPDHEPLTADERLWVAGDALNVVVLAD